MSCNIHLFYSCSIRTDEGLLSGLDFVTKAALDEDMAKKALAKPSVFTVTIFDGRVFEVKVGASGDSAKKHFSAINAKKGENTAASDGATIDWIYVVMATNSFEVSSSVASRFEKGFEDMIEKKESKS